MTVEIVPATADQVPQLGDICYRAFEDISSRHGFPTDFDSPEIAQMVIGSLVSNEACYSTAATLDGELAGSNFLTTADQVGSVGPISVDPAMQGHGIGRALMEDLLAHARDNDIEQVRLLQDSFNMQSLALYASLGFDTKAPCALMVPKSIPSDNVRPATEDDLNVVEALSREIYGVSRRNEVAHHLTSPFRPFVLKKGGRISAYYIPGMIGHGVGETEEALVETVLGSSAEVGEPFHRVFCPLIEGSLYRRFLAAGCTNRKVMNLMTIGPYDMPTGPWLPSVGF
jgi:ribosomal protein S18 acetylase RimI-like enzyme